MSDKDLALQRLVESGVSHPDLALLEISSLAVKRMEEGEVTPEELERMNQVYHNIELLSRCSS